MCSDCCCSCPYPGESGQGLRPLWGLLPICMWWLDQPASSPRISDLVGPISSIAGETAGTVERCVATVEFWYYPNVLYASVYIYSLVGYSAWIHFPHTGFEILTAVMLRFQVFQDVMLCHWVNRFLTFWRNVVLLLQKPVSFGLKVKVLHSLHMLGATQP